MEKRAKFVAAYLADPKRSITEAALTAGFGRTRQAAAVSGSKLLQDPDIKRQIDAALERDIKRFEITRERVLNELASIAFANAMDYGRVENGQFVIDLNGTSREQMAALSEIESNAKTVGRGKAAQIERTTKIKIRGKREALVDIGKHLGLFKDDGPPPASVTFNIVGLAPEALELSNGPIPKRRGRPPRVAGPQANAEFEDPAHR